MDLLQEMQVRFGVGNPIQQADGESRADWLTRLMWLLSRQSGLPSYFEEHDEELEHTESGQWGADRLDNDCPVAVVLHVRHPAEIQRVVLYSHYSGDVETTLAYGFGPDYVMEYGRPEAIILARPDGVAEWHLGGPQ